MESEEVKSRTNFQRAPLPPAVYRLAVVDYQRISVRQTSSDPELPGSRTLASTATANDGDWNWRFGGDSL